MSIVSQLIAAFKKGAEGKDPNWPPPNTGPRNVPGSDSPQDDGREFRNPPQDRPPGMGEPSPDFKTEDSPVVEDPDAGGEVASLKENIDPAFVRRLRFSPDIEPSVQSSDPEEGGEVAARLRSPLEVKGESSGIVEDPDAGGEVASLKENIDPAFVRRLRFSSDTEPSVQSSDPEEGGEVVARLRSPAAEEGGPAIASSDPEEGGEVTGGGSGLERGIPEGHVPGGGSGLERGIPEGHVPGGGAGERGIPECHVPGGGAGERGIPEGHVPGGELPTVPNASLDLHLAEGVDQMVSAEPGSEPRRGNLLTQIDQEGGTDTPPPDRDEPDDQDSEGEGELISLGDGRGSRVNDPRDPNQIPGALDDRLSDERGEGPIGGLKLEGDYKVAEVGRAIASSDPEEGGEIGTDPADGGDVFSRLRPHPPVGEEIPAGSLLEQSEVGGDVFSEVKFKIEPAYLKFGEYKVEPEPGGFLKVEGGIKFEGAKFDDTQNVAGFAPSASPPGVPTPYPNVDGDGDDLAEGLARKAGGGQQDFFKVKMEEVMVTSARPGGEPLDEDGPPDDEGSGVTDWIAKKRGKGGLGFLDDQAGEASVTRGTLGDIAGESQDKDHKVAAEFARRTEVKDAHDRFSDTNPDTPPKPPAPLIDDDDDFESSSLLDLKPESDVKEMLPGLAGELPDVAELEFDLDDDLDDTDESEL